MALATTTSSSSISISYTSLQYYDMYILDIGTTVSESAQQMDLIKKLEESRLIRLALSTDICRNSRLQEL